MFTIKSEQMGGLEGGAGLPIETIDNQVVEDTDLNGTSINELIKYYRTNYSEGIDNDNLVMIDTKEEEHIRSEIEKITDNTKEELNTFLEKSIKDSEKISLAYKKLLLQDAIKVVDTQGEGEFRILSSGDMYYVYNTTPSIIPDGFIDLPLAGGLLGAKAIPQSKLYYAETMRIKPQELVTYLNSKIDEIKII